MKILLDTHLLLWAAAGAKQLPTEAVELVSDPSNGLYFSAVSIWEVAIKSGVRRPGLVADPHLVRRNLLDNAYEEIPVTSEHAIAVTGLPSLHKDPFDRLLIAQALVEGILLLTSDSKLAQYPGPIRHVRRAG